MNERIKLLAEQAGVKYSLWVGSKPAAYMTYDELEKFAELLVRECMRMCEVAQVGYLTHGLEKEASGAFSVKQYIEEYLGVNE
jgi:hypothetical protein